MNNRMNRSTAESFLAALKGDLRGDIVINHGGSPVGKPEGMTGLVSILDYPEIYLPEIDYGGPLSNELGIETTAYIRDYVNKNPELNILFGHSMGADNVIFALAGKLTEQYHEAIASMPNSTIVLNHIGNIKKENVSTVFIISLTEDSKGYIGLSTFF